MATKTQIKEIKSLRQKKYRSEFGLYVIEGKKMIEEAIAANQKFEHLFYSEELNLTKVLRSAGAEKVTVKEMEMMTHQNTPSTLLGVLAIPARQSFYDVRGIVLVLDGIKDPGNLGTIIRTADWFGISTVVGSNECVELYNNKVIQATMGSCFRVNYQQEDLSKFFEYYKREIKGEIVGTVLDGVNLYGFDFGRCENLLIVIGNESTGISDEAKAQLDHRITIPKIRTGGAESLNAGVATAIITAEIVRTTVV